mmetsp:Transcript_7160/g.16404  ORF Transcript_7160/g.16404 Transcript_7160/m.16404 type:complete len:226 (-) Transcript_7160:285-962(-)
MISNLPSASRAATAGHAATKFLSCLCFVLIMDSASLTSGGSGGELNHPPIVPSDVQPLPLMFRTSTSVTFSSAFCITCLSAFSSMRASAALLSFSAASFCWRGSWRTRTASLALHLPSSFSASTRSTLPTPSEFQSSSEPSKADRAMWTGMGFSIQHSILILREIAPSTVFVSAWIRSSQSMDEKSFLSTACNLFPYLSIPSPLIGCMSSLAQSARADSAEVQFR